MNTENELVKKLREESMYRDKCTFQIMDLCLDAAYKIEYQAREIERLRKLLKNREKQIIEHRVQKGTVYNL